MHGSSNSAHDVFARVKWLHPKKPDIYHLYRNIERCDIHQAFFTSSKQNWGKKQWNGLHENRPHVVFTIRQYYMDNITEHLQNQAEVFARFYQPATQAPLDTESRQLLLDLPGYSRLITRFFSLRLAIVMLVLNRQVKRKKPIKSHLGLPNRHTRRKHWSMQN